MIQPSILNSLRVAVSFLSNVHFSSLTVSSLMIYRLEHWWWNRAMSKKKRARPSFLFPLMCMSKSSFRPAPSARYFLLFGWPFDERCLPPWLNTPSRKKKGTCSLWKILWWWTPRGRAEENIFAIQATIDHSHC